MIINPDSKTSNSLGRSTRQAVKCDINVVMNGLVVWENPELIFSRLLFCIYCIYTIIGKYQEELGVICVAFVQKALIGPSEVVYMAV